MCVLRVRGACACVARDKAVGVCVRVEQRKRFHRPDVRPRRAEPPAPDAAAPARGPRGHRGHAVPPADVRRRGARALRGQHLQHRPGRAPAHPHGDRHHPLVAERPLPEEGQGHLGALHRCRPLHPAAGASTLGAQMCTAAHALATACPFFGRSASSPTSLATRSSRARSTASSCTSCRSPRTRTPSRWPWARASRASTTRPTRSPATRTRTSSRPSRAPTPAACSRRMTCHLLTRPVSHFKHAGCHPLLLTPAVRVLGSLRASLSGRPLERAHYSTPSHPPSCCAAGLHVGQPRGERVAHSNIHNVHALTDTHSLLFTEGIHEVSAPAATRQKRRALTS